MDPEACFVLWLSADLLREIYTLLDMFSMFSFLRVCKTFYAIAKPLRRLRSLLPHLQQSSYYGWTVNDSLFLLGESGLLRRTLKDGKQPFHSARLFEGQITAFTHRDDRLVLCSDNGTLLTSAFEFLQCGVSCQGWQRDFPLAAVVTSEQLCITRDRFYVAASDANIYGWDWLENGDQMKCIQQNNGPVSMLSYHPATPDYFYALANGRVSVIQDGAFPACVSSWAPSLFFNRLSLFCPSWRDPVQVLKPLESGLLYGGYDKLHLRDFATLTEKDSLKFPNSCGKKCSLASTQGDTLLYGSALQQIHCWDWRCGPEPTHTIPAYADKTLSPEGLFLLNGERILCTFSPTDTALKFWDTRRLDTELIAHYTDPLLSVTQSGDDLIVATTKDTFLYRT